MVKGEDMYYCTEKSHITEKGKYYGDVEANGINSKDALQIQKYLCDNYHRREYDCHNADNII